ncbi:phenylalanine--tRNA ligase subunit beta [Helicobacter enhydrae]|uniref:Phenylalanine--tRNA ligase beta subunit n=1 Tax=Helicobacter enhydrae TaxID=222136 RepID=A0A1B1U4U5_9HELI|nr:phenylalanine--tRNA ligase subunit beta [Helicobacter enhydrae]ANV97793.1 phenylalanine--tRNA ligase subunit beta [Helicobacter enhydrae]
MKVTKHLLEEFIRIGDIAPQTLCDTLSQIGLEVESFQAIKIPDGVVVGKVIDKAQHPNADKLSVCQVDIGSQTLQIVCGASNVATEQYIALATQGTKLNTPKGELCIAPTTLREVRSEGMICSSVELGLPQTNEGIMVLDSSIGELKLGRALNTYPIFNNFIIQIGITPNRGDCLSVIGVARDLSVALGVPFSLKSYQDENTALGIGRVLQMANEGKNNASLLYKVANIISIHTPLNIQLSLLMCDIALQSGLQNFLSFASHLSGVILKPYRFGDFSKSNLINNAEAQIIIKQDEEGFDCTYNQNKLARIGVFYPKNDIGNESVILEASYVNPEVLSQLLHTHKEIQKDSELTYKTTRGSNPNLLLGMQILCDLLIKYAHVEIYSSSHHLSTKEENIGIKTTFSYILELLGEQICKEDIALILKRLGFKIEASFDESFFMATPPEYRHDIKMPQDIAEEILRIYRINKVTSIPLTFQEYPQACNEQYQFYKYKRELIKKACAIGFTESIHYVFYDKDKLKALNLLTLPDTLDLINPINNELNTLRSSLIPAMLDTIERNLCYGIESIALCEIGICYDSARNEIERLAFAVNALQQEERFPYPKGIKWDFYRFCDQLSKIIGNFTLQEYPFSSSLLTHPYQKALIVQDHKQIGYVAKINPMSGYSFEGFICEINLNDITINQQKASAFSKHQTSLRDLTLLIDTHTTFDQIKTAILREQIPFLIEIYPIDLYSHESLGSQIALSLRLKFQAQDKTLQEEEVKHSIQQILTLLDQTFNATLR